MILLAFAFGLEPPQAVASCSYDHAAMLALDERAFDQDLEGGWRSVSARPGCERAAADLIRDYREAHGSQATILYWHEGQLRSSAGQTEEAIALFERSRKGPDDIFGWNHYVDATIAFLRRDLPGLLLAREALARLPRPQDFAPVDMNGRPVALRWPMNLDVVDGLIACFGRSYAEAYGAPCRPTPPRN